MEKKILAIIPARAGSKAIKKKNIRLLNDKPLIAYTIEEAIKSKSIDRVIVSTDSEEIAEIAKSFGAEVPYLRSKDLAQDNSKIEDAIEELLNKLDSEEKYIPDYILLLQCTSPFRKVEHIEEAIKSLLESNYDAIISLCEAEVNPYWTNVIDEKGNLKYFLEEGIKIKQRQLLPKIYRYNGAIYLIKRETFKKEKSLEAKNLTGYIMSKEDSLDIDEEIDFLIAEELIKGKRGI
ncbi:MAG: cytidylyltransferase domain-containing protein [Sarcina sp.]